MQECDSKSWQTIRTWHCFCFSLCLFLGCGSPQGTEITGKVTLDGKPLNLDENVHGTVVFQPASRQGPTLNGMIDPKGRFQLTAGSSTTVAPGVYLVTVSAVEIQKATEENPQAVGRRVTPARYANSSDSGLRVAVTPGENAVLLELVSETETQEESEKEAEAVDSSLDSPTEQVETSKQQLDTQEK
ncbi:hypothetical protein [Bythopirellula polymerisocia]|uniref:Carboxypeptidase regulatory-like domain-containing protein n=1 Tax=Bythopirellula polymerisocia TaxID=2528003 RepID=A0A5C6CLL0_9BACT|nr:hypothetical protein [Bythopirellula polymerisocia]TWU25500.1 hypothetical protein Pla144_27050 [Bythopirellula polymerisocia]